MDLPPIPGYGDGSCREDPACDRAAGEHSFGCYGQLSLRKELEWARSEGRSAARHAARRARDGCVWCCQSTPARKRGEGHKHCGEN